jgi:hypothetical protein
MRKYTLSADECDCSYVYGVGESHEALSVWVENRVEYAKTSEKRPAAPRESQACRANGPLFRG